MIKRQMQGPQSVVSHHQTDYEPATSSVHKDSKGRGKPDPSPSPLPVKPPVKPVSCVGSGGGDERRTSNGVLDIHSQMTPNTWDTFCVCEEKEMSYVNNKDNTMELLKEADLQNPKMDLEREAAFSIPEKKSAHKSSVESVGVSVEANIDNKNETVNLFKGAPAKPHTSDIQVSALSNITMFLFFPH